MHQPFPITARRGRRTPGLVGLVPLTVLFLASAGCDIITPDGWLFQPFDGPSYDRDIGITDDLDDEHLYTVATTHLAVRPEGQESFDDHVNTLVESLDAAPDGLVGYSFGTQLTRNEYRTLTIWRDADAMYAWVVSPEHLAAMEDTTAIIDEEVPAKVLSWQATKDELPPAWSDVMTRVDEEGRTAAY